MKTLTNFLNEARKPKGYHFVVYTPKNNGKIVDYMEEAVTIVEVDGSGYYTQVRTETKKVVYKAVFNEDGEWTTTGRLQGQ